jgi:hypothetical protein
VRIGEESVHDEMAQQRTTASDGPRWAAGRQAGPRDGAVTVTGETADQLESRYTGTMQRVAASAVSPKLPGRAAEQSPVLHEARRGNGVPFSAY